MFASAPQRVRRTRYCRLPESPHPLPSRQTRIAAFSLLRQLLTTLPGCMADHAASLVPGLDKALKEDSSNHLRIEALLFLQLVLSSHPPKVFQPHAAVLLPSVRPPPTPKFVSPGPLRLSVIVSPVQPLSSPFPSVPFPHRATLAPRRCALSTTVTTRSRLKRCACAPSTCVYFAPPPLRSSLTTRRSSPHFSSASSDG